MKTIYVKPYISVIVTCRNDNYGGQFMIRFQNFLNWTARLAHEHSVPIECIVVEYNPPSNRPDLREAVTWPKYSPYFTPRIIQVPTPYHKVFLKNTKVKDIPLLEFFAKNIGIRRAQGDYILTTNTDILFDVGLVARLRNRPLMPDTLYRANRCDVPMPDPFDVVHSALLSSQGWLRRQAFRGYFPGGTYFLSRKGYLFKTFFAWLYHRLRSSYYTHDIGKLLRGFFPSVKDSEKLLFAYPFNASGDFLLTHRDVWRRLRGFKENAHISTHVDSLFLLKAIAMNTRIKLFSCYVYHQDHMRRYDPMNGNEEVEKMYKILVDQLEIYQKHGKYSMDNSEDWGLNGISLPEINI
ncbi:MAG: hypothetical protein OXB93_03055 [Cytophagales bacterium]|nr:hypothetical protein [Cytophagales bacterium]